MDASLIREMQDPAQPEMHIGTTQSPSITTELQICLQPNPILVIKWHVLEEKEVNIPVFPNLQVLMFAKEQQPIVQAVDVWTTFAEPLEVGPTLNSILIVEM